MTDRTRSVLIFVGVLVALRIVGLRVSILGSLALTFFVWLVIAEFSRRR